MQTRTKQYPPVRDRKDFLKRLAKFCCDCTAKAEFIIANKRFATPAELQDAAQTIFFAGF